MGRSRSRSPTRKERRRSRSPRDRERDRDRRRRHKSRSRSPRPQAHRSRSRSPVHRSISPDNDDVVFLGTTREPIVVGEPRTKRNRKKAGVSADGDITVDDTDMMKLMGFSDFNTTKGKHVAGNDTSASNIVQKRKYRQYMNRRGGFNRPLDYVA